MKKNRNNYFTALLFGAIAFAVAAPGIAYAQGSMEAAKPYIEKAKEMAWRPKDGLFDMTELYETVCAPAMKPEGFEERAVPTPPPFEKRKIPQKSDWYQEPAKVFDNLYWLGSWGDFHRIPTTTGDSTWAVNTSDGIILIDSGYDYSAPTLIGDGLKKVGLDPAQIKYVILSHAHSDRYYGSKWIQDTYHAHIIMSAADWDVLANSENNDYRELMPKRDMVATDGEKLTLGDTTLTLYITPGHTPGTISTIIPLKDGNEKHVGAIWGGINPSLIRSDVRYYPDWQTTFKTWAASAERFKAIAAKAGVDTFLTIHPFYDNAIERIHLEQYRQPGDPNPMVNKDALPRFVGIIQNCTLAQLARIAPVSAKGQ
jgi:metallo-beta-lactamase class B